MEKKEKNQSKLGRGIEDIGAVVSNIANKAKRKTGDVKDSVVDAMDVNGNGEFDIEDIIIYGLKIPGIHVDRGNFLRKEFM